MRPIRLPELFGHSSSSDDVDDENVIRDIEESLERRIANEVAFPNKHFYRHLPVGEAPRSGPWLASEKERFFIRLQELQGNEMSR
jgi:hypothetical protein